MSEQTLINELIDLLKPIVLELHYEFYNLEFVNEDGENYLRIYIDNEKGIDLSDCEKVSRKISETLDKVDPIEVSYYLEVSSPGIFRQLFTDEHLNKNIDSKVSVTLKEDYNGKNKYIGKLKSFTETNIIIDFKNRDLSIPRNIVDKVNLEGKA
ncbi:ribosome maturation factor RimP [Clostridium acidisoli DSM 12555]|uniref:Ribosome maturation factor RimP n=1 Tax=Clostridium acidisoli DSM 12555 TaxID=1121291 RepID=A0A1W1XCB4_9CLOT|nr:ribosome maturation factor RimP [Clostridium acidisoli DSM 12555]